MRRHFVAVLLIENGHIVSYRVPMKPFYISLRAGGRCVATFGTGTFGTGCPFLFAAMLPLEQAAFYLFVGIARMA